MKDRIAAFVLKNLTYFDSQRLSGYDLGELLARIEALVTDEIKRSQGESVPIRRPYSPVEAEEPPTYDPSPLHL